MTLLERRTRRRYARRRRTNVRVGGCCLPIPLVLVAASGVGLRLAIARRRG